MKHISLGGLDVSRIGLGAPTIAGAYTSGCGLDNTESIRSIHRALELGVTHIDTAALEEPIRVASGDLVLTRDRRGAALPPHLVPQSRFHTD